MEKNPVSLSNCVSSNTVPVTVEFVGKGLGKLRGVVTERSVGNCDGNVPKKGVQARSRGTGTT